MPARKTTVLQVDDGDVLPRSRHPEVPAKRVPEGKWYGFHLARYEAPGLSCTLQDDPGVRGDVSGTDPSVEAKSRDGSGSPLGKRLSQILKFAIRAYCAAISNVPGELYQPSQRRPGMRVRLDTPANAFSPPKKLARPNESKVKGPQDSGSGRTPLSSPGAREISDSMVEIEGIVVELT